MSPKCILSAAALLLPTLALSAGSDEPTAPEDASATPPVPALQSARGYDLSIEGEVFFTNGAGPAYSFVQALDSRMNSMFGPDMEELASALDDFTYELPGPSHLKGTLAGAKIVLGTPPTQWGSFSFEASFRAGTVDDDSGEKPFAGTLDFLYDSEVGLNGSLSHKASVDCHESSLAVYWAPRRIGDWVNFGLEYAHGEYDATYDMNLSLALTMGGTDILTERILNRFEQAIKSNDFLLHVRSSLKAIPIRGFAGGRLSILPGIDLAAGYSLRDRDDTVGTEFYDGEEAYSGITSDPGLTDDMWVFQGNAFLTALYAIRGGTLRLGVGGSYAKDLNADKAERTAAVVKFGYSRHR
jgi:hypothetical protein